MMNFEEDIIQSILSKGWENERGKTADCVWMSVSWASFVWNHYTYHLLGVPVALLMSVVTIKRLGGRHKANQHKNNQNSESQNAVSGQKFPDSSSESCGSSRKDEMGTRSECETDLLAEGRSGLESSKTCSPCQETETCLMTAATHSSLSCVLDYFNKVTTLRNEACKVCATVTSHLGKEDQLPHGFAKSAKQASCAQKEVSDQATSTSSIKKTKIPKKITYKMATLPRNVEQTVVSKQDKATNMSEPHLPTVSPHRSVPLLCCALQKPMTEAIENSEVLKKANISLEIKALCALSTFSSISDFCLSEHCTDGGQPETTLKTAKLKDDKPRNAGLPCMPVHAIDKFQEIKCLQAAEFQNKVSLSKENELNASVSTKLGAGLELEITQLRAVPHLNTNQPGSNPASDITNFQNKVSKSSKEMSCAPEAKLLNHLERTPTPHKVKTLLDKEKCHPVLQREKMVKVHSRMYVKSKLDLPESGSVVTVDEAAMDLMSGNFSSICRKYSVRKESKESTHSSMFASPNDDTTCHEQLEEETSPSLCWLSQEMGSSTSKVKMQRTSANSHSPLETSFNMLFKRPFKPQVNTSPCYRRQNQNVGRRTRMMPKSNRKLANVESKLKRVLFGVTGSQNKQQQWESKQPASDLIGPPRLGPEDNKHRLDPHKICTDKQQKCMVPYTVLAPYDHRPKLPSPHGKQWSDDAPRSRLGTSCDEKIHVHAAGNGKTSRNDHAVDTDKFISTTQKKERSAEMKFFVSKTYSSSCQSSLPQSKLGQNDALEIDVFHGMPRGCESTNYRRLFQGKMKKNASKDPQSTMLRSEKYSRRGSLKEGKQGFADNFYRPCAVCLKEKDSQTPDISAVLATCKKYFGKDENSASPYSSKTESLKNEMSNSSICTPENDAKTASHKIMKYKKVDGNKAHGVCSSFDKEPTSATVGNYQSSERSSGHKDQTVKYPLQSKNGPSLPCHQCPEQDKLLVKRGKIAVKKLNNESTQTNGGQSYTGGPLNNKSAKVAKDEKIVYKDDDQDGTQETKSRSKIVESQLRFEKAHYPSTCKETQTCTIDHLVDEHIQTEVVKMGALSSSKLQQVATYTKSSTDQFEELRNVIIGLAKQNRPKCSNCEDLNTEVKSLAGQTRHAAVNRLVLHPTLQDSEETLGTLMTKSPAFAHFPLFNNKHSEAVNIIIRLETSAQKNLVKKVSMPAVLEAPEKGIHPDQNKGDTDDDDDDDDSELLTQEAAPELLTTTAFPGSLESCEESKMQNKKKSRFLKGKNDSLDRDTEIKKKNFHHKIRSSDKKSHLLDNKHDDSKVQAKEKVDTVMVNDLNESRVSQNIGDDLCSQEFSSTITSSKFPIKHKVETQKTRPETRLESKNQHFKKISKHNLEDNPKYNKVYVHRNTENKGASLGVNEGCLIVKDMNSREVTEEVKHPKSHNIPKTKMQIPLSKRNYFSQRHKILSSEVQKSKYSKGGRVCRNETKIQNTFTNHKLADYLRDDVNCNIIYIGNSRSVSPNVKCGSLFGEDCKNAKSVDSRKNIKDKISKDLSGLPSADQIKFQPEDQTKFTYKDRTRFSSDDRTRFLPKDRTRFHSEGRTRFPSEDHTRHFLENRAKFLGDNRTRIVAENQKRACFNNRQQIISTDYRSKLPKYNHSRMSAADRAGASTDTSTVPVETHIKLPDENQPWLAEAGTQASTQDHARRLNFKNSKHCKNKYRFTRNQPVRESKQSFASMETSKYEEELPASTYHFKHQLQNRQHSDGQDLTGKAKLTHLSDNEDLMKENETYPKMFTKKTRAYNKDMPIEYDVTDLPHYGKIYQNDHQNSPFSISGPVRKTRFSGSINPVYKYTQGHIKEGNQTNPTETSDKNMPHIKNRIIKDGGDLIRAVRNIPDALAAHSEAERCSYKESTYVNHLKRRRDGDASIDKADKKTKMRSSEYQETVEMQQYYTLNLSPSPLFASPGKESQALYPMERSDFGQHKHSESFHGKPDFLSSCDRTVSPSDHVHNTTKKLPLRGPVSPNLKREKNGVSSYSLLLSSPCVILEGHHRQDSHSNKLEHPKSSYKKITEYPFPSSECGKPSKKLKSPVLSNSKAWIIKSQVPQQTSSLETSDRAETSVTTGAEKLLKNKPKRQLKARGVAGKNQEGYREKKSNGGTHKAASISENASLFKTLRPPLESRTTTIKSQLEAQNNFSQNTDSALLSANKTLRAALPGQHKRAHVFQNILLRKLLKFRTHPREKHKLSDELSGAGAAVTVQERTVSQVTRHKEHAKVQSKQGTNNVLSSCDTYKVDVGTRHLAHSSSGSMHTGENVHETKDGKHHPQRSHNLRRGFSKRAHAERGRNTLKQINMQTFDPVMPASKENHHTFSIKGRQEMDSDLQTFADSILDEAEDCRLPDHMPGKIGGSTDASSSLNISFVGAAKNTYLVTSESAENRTTVLESARPPMQLSVDELREKYLQEMVMKGICKKEILTHERNGNYHNYLLGNRSKTSNNQNLEYNNTTVRSPGSESSVLRKALSGDSVPETINNSLISSKTGHKRKRQKDKVEDRLTNADDAIMVNDSEPRSEKKGAASLSLLDKDSHSKTTSGSQKASLHKNDSISVKRGTQEIHKIPTHPANSEASLEHTAASGLCLTHTVVTLNDSCHKEMNKIDCSKSTRELMPTGDLSDRAVKDHDVSQTSPRSTLANIPPMEQSEAAYQTFQHPGINKTKNFSYTLDNGLVKTAFALKENSVSCKERPISFTRLDPAGRKTSHAHRRKLSRIPKLQKHVICTKRQPSKIHNYSRTALGLKESLRDRAVIMSATLHCNKTNTSCTGKQPVDNFLSAQRLPHETNSQLPEKFDLQRDDNSKSPGSSTDVLISWVDKSNTQDTFLQESDKGLFMTSDGTFHTQLTNKDSVSTAWGFQSYTLSPTFSQSEVMSGTHRSEHVEGDGHDASLQKRRQDRHPGESLLKANARQVGKVKEYHPSWSTASDTRHRKDIHTEEAANVRRSENEHLSCHGKLESIPARTGLTTNTTAANESVIRKNSTLLKKSAFEKHNSGVAAPEKFSNNAEDILRETTANKPTDKLLNIEPKAKDPESKVTTAVNLTLPGPMRTTRWFAKNRKYVNSALMYNKKKQSAVSPDKSHNNKSEWQIKVEDPALGTNNSARRENQEPRSKYQLPGTKQMNFRVTEVSLKSKGDPQCYLHQSNKGHDLETEVRKQDQNAASFCSKHVSFSDRKGASVAKSDLVKAQTRPTSEQEVASLSEEKCTASGSELRLNETSLNVCSRSQNSEFSNANQAMEILDSHYVQQDSEEQEDNEGDEDSDNKSNILDKYTDGSQSVASASYKVSFDWYKPSALRTIVTTQNRQEPMRGRSSVERGDQTSEELVDQAATENCQLPKVPRDGQASYGMPWACRVLPDRESNEPAGPSQDSWLSVTLQTPSRVQFHQSVHFPTQIKSSAEHTPGFGYPVGHLLLAESTSPASYNTEFSETQKSNRNEVTATSQCLNQLHSLRTGYHTIPQVSGNRHAAEAPHHIPKRIQGHSTHFASMLPEDTTVSNLNALYQNLQQNYNRANAAFHSNWILANQHSSLNPIRNIPEQFNCCNNTTNNVYNGHNQQPLHVCSETEENVTGTFHLPHHDTFTPHVVFSQPPAHVDLLLPTRDQTSDHSNEEALFIQVRPHRPFFSDSHNDTLNNPQSQRTAIQQVAAMNIPSMYPYLFPVSDMNMPTRHNSNLNFTSSGQQERLQTLCHTVAPQHSSYLQDYSTGQRDPHEGCRLSPGVVGLSTCAPCTATEGSHNRAGTGNK